MNTAFALKDEITLTLPSTHDHNVPPTLVPSALTRFLAAACHLTHDDVVGAWMLFKDVIWSGIVPMRSGTSSSFQRLGRQTGVCVSIIFIIPHR